MPARSLPVVVFVTVFLDVVGFAVLIPLQPFYVETAGGTGVHVGALFAAYSFAQFATVPLWGRLSDRVGRRPVILTTLMGTALAFFVFAAAGNRLWLLFASRIAAGAFGGTLSAAQAYIGDVTGPEDRARGMGLVGAAFGLGFVVGPALGAGLAFLGPVWPPAFAGVLAIVNAGVAAVLLAESREARREAHGAWRWFDPQGWRAARTSPALLGAFAILFLGTVAFSHLETTFALLLGRNLGLDRSGASLFFVYIGLIAVVVQGGLIGRLTRRFGSARLVVVGTMLLAATLAWLPAAATVPAMLALCAAVAVGTSLNRPSLNTFVSLLAGETSQGALLGSAASLASLARVMGPAVAGLLWDLGPALPYQVGAAIMVLACVLAVALARAAPDNAAVAPPGDAGP